MNRIVLFGLTAFLSLYGCVKEPLIKNQPASRISIAMNAAGNDIKAEDYNTALIHSFSSSGLEFRDTAILFGSHYLSSHDHVQDTPGKARIYVAAPFCSQTRSITDDGFTFAVPSDITKQVDLIIGRSEEYSAPQSKPLSVDMVHALSRVRVIAEDCKINASVKSVSFNGICNTGAYGFVHAGVYEPSSGWVVARGMTDRFYSTYRSEIRKEGTYALTGDRCFLMLPQTLGTQATLSVEMAMDVGRDTTVKFSIGGDVWSMGYTHTYCLSFSSMENKIVVSMSADKITPWNDAQSFSSFMSDEYTSGFELLAEPEPDYFLPGDKISLKLVETVMRNGEVVAYSSRPATGGTFTLRKDGILTDDYIQFDSNFATMESKRRTFTPNEEIPLEMEYAVNGLSYKTSFILRDSAEYYMSVSPNGPVTLTIGQPSAITAMIHTRNFRTKKSGHTSSDITTSCIYTGQDIVWDNPLEAGMQKLTAANGVINTSWGIISGKVKVQFRGSNKVDPVFVPVRADNNYSNKVELYYAETGAVVDGGIAIKRTNKASEYVPLQVKYNLYCNDIFDHTEQGNVGFDVIPGGGLFCTRSRTQMDKFYLATSIQQPIIPTYGIQITATMGGNSKSRTYAASATEGPVYSITFDGMGEYVKGAFYEFSDNIYSIPRTSVDFSINRKNTSTGEVVDVTALCEFEVDVKKNPNAEWVADEDNGVTISGSSMIFSSATGIEYRITATYREDYWCEPVKTQVIIERI